MSCPLAEEPPAPPAYPMAEGLMCSTPRDALLGAQPALPPPSYESVILLVDAIPGDTTPADRSERRPRLMELLTLEAPEARDKSRASSI